jgi:hypothetical protein
LQREIETCVPLFYDLSEDRLQRLKWSLGTGYTAYA